MITWSASREGRFALANLPSRARWHPQGDVAEGKQSGLSRNIDLPFSRKGRVSIVRIYQADGQYFRSQERAHLVAREAGGIFRTIRLPADAGSCANLTAWLDELSRTDGTPVPPDLRDLSDYCEANGRVCPTPREWHELWQLITRSYALRAHCEVPARSDSPPLPRILSSWWASSDRDKRITLWEQLEWAYFHGVLDEARLFLAALSNDQWKYEPDHQLFLEMCDRRSLAGLDRQRLAEERTAARGERMRQAQAHRDRKCAIDQRYRDSLDQALIAAYRATDYVAFTQPAIVLHIGEASEVLGGLLADHGTTCAAYITAWNPRGEACSDVANAQAERQLIAAIEEAGHDWIAGEGRGQIGDWPPERSALIFGCSRGKAKQLGHRFRQNAVVWIGPDIVPELIMLMPLNAASFEAPQGTGCAGDRHNEQR